MVQQVLYIYIYIRKSYYAALMIRLNTPHHVLSGRSIYTSEFNLYTVSNVLCTNLGLS